MLTYGSIHWNKYSLCFLFIHISISTLELLWLVYLIGRFRSRFVILPRESSVHSLFCIATMLLNSFRQSYYGCRGVCKRNCYSFLPRTTAPLQNMLLQSSLKKHLSWGNRWKSWKCLVATVKYSVKVFNPFLILWILHQAILKLLNHVQKLKWKQNKMWKPSCRTKRNGIFVVFLSITLYVLFAVGWHL